MTSQFVIEEEPARGPCLLQVKSRLRCGFGPCPLYRRNAVTPSPPSAMCGRLRVGKDFLHVTLLVGAAMCSASHDGISVKSCFGQTAIQGGALISAGFPAKPHIRRELTPTTVPHSGRESSKRTAPLYIDGAAAPCRTTATFPRIAGLLCVRSATRIAGSIRQQALRLRLQALHRR